VLDRLVECAAEVEIIFDFESPEAALGINPDFIKIAVKLFSNEPKPRLPARGLRFPACAGASFGIFA
jgi:hypothetical protein